MRPSRTVASTRSLTLLQRVALADQAANYLAAPSGGQQHADRAREFLSRILHHVGHGVV